MKKIFIISFILLITFIPAILQAQLKNARQPQAEPHIPRLVLTGAAMGDSVVLRWAPADATDWKVANEQGYILERTTLSADNKVEVNFEKLRPGPIKPWGKDEMLANLSTANNGDKYTAIAAQALYGASFKPATGETQEPLDEFKALVKQHNEDMMRYSFALFSADINVKAATALGLRYVDKNVVRNKKYIYRLYAVPRPGLLKTDTALFIISPKDVATINRVVFVKGNSHNKEVFLDWPKNETENNFTAFFIERSDDNGKTYMQLNKDPFTNINGTPEQLRHTVIAFADTVPELYKNYTYRVRGINLFAQYSPYSLPVVIMAKDDNAPPPPGLNRTVKLSNTSYRINWTQPGNATDIKGYNVSRSTRLDSNYAVLNKNLLPVSARQFVDSAARAGQSYYYRVTAVDTAGNSSTSLPDYVFTYDTIPPAPPVGLAGSIDTNGVVTLRWHLGQEDDLKGYRIYKANAADHEFTPISKELIQDTVFSDTIVLKTLTREIFYKAVAVDNNLNNSGYSLPVELIKPDVVPPVPAVFTNYNATDTSIQLYWNASTSSDLNKQYLYRKAAGGDWEQVAVLDKNQSAYIDTSMQKQMLYAYQLVSEDSSGLKSEPSFPVNAKTYFSAKENGDGEIKATLQQDSVTVVKVQWTLKRNAHPANIILYRSVNGGVAAMYENIPATQTMYIDKRVSAGNTYAYSFKCVYGGNNQGILSQETSVAIAK